MIKNLYLFTGANNVGKSHTMLVLAKLLAMLNKNVAVIDGTKDQGVYNYFNYNKDVENNRALKNLKPIIREDISIFANDPIQREDINFEILKSFKFDNYDLVFIEADEYTSEKLISYAKRIFLVQNSDKDKLLRNVNLLKRVNIDADKLTFIFNQILENKFDIMYLLNSLVQNLYNRAALINNEFIDIPYYEDDIILSLNNKVDGRISIKNYSDDFKHAMFDLINKVITISDKEFNKLMRNGRV